MRRRSHCDPARKDRRKERGGGGIRRPGQIPHARHEESEGRETKHRMDPREKRKQEEEEEREGEKEEGASDGEAKVETWRNSRLSQAFRPWRGTAWYRVRQWPVQRLTMQGRVTSLPSAFFDGCSAPFAGPPDMPS
ncbi:hypothetical protein P170DRAFT_237231 [Aspergillus steynii IBT 23096]|uniref:Uncharacterized protein n=1 Tax=Aspergillus steynii IBT 23096 TaxID=1392250 RepID=A0A2I2G300_9EURO|nr:uncharacterized protein P170DRAFT_237231 [Aspergillus steynii IBT 23096]PLB47249.1 hypothetical protein P170DRAFT_237231 [Aspergillus steynii IBT 23096]